MGSSISFFLSRSVEKRCLLITMVTISTDVCTYILNSRLSAESGDTQEPQITDWRIIHIGAENE